MSNQIIFNIVEKQSVAELRSKFLVTKKLVG